MTAMNDQIIETFRSNAGVVGGHFEGKRQYETHTTRKFPIVRLDPVAA
jgi:hypothetical protein